MVRRVDAVSLRSDIISPITIVSLGSMRIEAPIAGYQVAQGEAPINPTGDHTLRLSTPLVVHALLVFCGVPGCSGGGTHQPNR